MEKNGIPVENYQPKLNISHIAVLSISHHRQNITHYNSVDQHKLHWLNVNLSPIRSQSTTVSTINHSEKSNFKKWCKKYCIL